MCVAAIVAADYTAAGDVGLHVMRLPYVLLPGSAKLTEAGWKSATKSGATKFKIPIDRSLGRPTGSRSKSSSRVP